MRSLLVMNPTAGSSARTQTEILERAAQELGHALDIVLPDSPAATEAATRRGMAAGYDRICCAGGDGTVNRMAAVLAGSAIPLGIIPTGTVNVLARELHLPLDPVKALHVALQGRVRRIDMGQANDHPFLLMAGLGFDAQVVSEIVPRIKELFGPLAYVTAGLQVLTRFKSSVFTLEVDGVRFSIPAWLVVVGNAGYYSYQLPLAPEARLDDGLLDICLFAERNALDRLTQIGAFFAGRHMQHPNVSYFRAAHLHIDADPTVQVQVDGDPAGTTPLDLSIRPAALQVIVGENAQEP